VVLVGRRTKKLLSSFLEDDGSQDLTSTVDVPISSSEILNCFDSSIEMVPGSEGKVLVPERIVWSIDAPETAPYTIGFALWLSLGDPLDSAHSKTTLDTLQYLLGNVEVAVVGADVMTENSAFTSMEVENVVGLPLLLTAQAANPTDGDADLLARITYKAMPV